MLRNCLRGLVAQLDERDEVVVVDDGGFDRRVVEECRAESPAARVSYVTVPHRGYRLATLCAGVQRSKNEVVAKVDGDVVPGKGWAPELRSTVGPGVLVAGRIDWRLQ